MPSLEEHCKISLERTKGKDDFRELHKWMDEPKESLGVNHRLERHAYSEAHRLFIESRWGDKAVVEWLFHIAIDNLVTAYKASNDVYFTAYNYYRFALPTNGEIVIDFDKLTDAELIRRFRDKKD